MSVGRMGEFERRAAAADPATGPAPTTAGPHRSDLLNKLDPRVDSDLDGSATLGRHKPVQPAHNVPGTTVPAASRVPEGTYGPHSTRVANAVDPRVDSDLDGSRRAGAGEYAATSRAPHEGIGGARAAHGMPAATQPVEPRPGGYVPEGTYGPHHSRLANALDPRVDSDLDGSRTMGSTRPAQPYTGPAPTTAGPHRTDLANKLDPNVDSTMRGRY